MADSIIVMNHGRIEQSGEPAELYERPATAFVASFLGVSNLLEGEITGPDAVRLDNGTLIHVAPADLAGRSGRVAVGIRPEKLQVGTDERNTLGGEVTERAYVGVSTQYIVRTPVGELTVVGQEHQSLGLVVEAANGIEVALHTSGGEKIDDGFPLLGIGSGADDLAWLVQP